jgi:MYND finger
MRHKAGGCVSCCAAFSLLTTTSTKKKMVASAESTSRNAVATKDYVPADGSWVAELEEAKDEMAELLRFERREDGTSSTKRGEALKVYLRLCRAHSTLRQWEKLDAASQKGLQHCSSYTSPRSADKVAPWRARFHTYRNQARTELAVPTSLDDPEMQEMLRNVIKEDLEPDFVPWPDESFPNSNVFHNAAVSGDIRLMEAVVARGAAIEYPFLDDPRMEAVAPTDATALVMACVMIALNDLDVPSYVEDSPEAAEDETRRTLECAMQLVRLGADPTRRLRLCHAAETPHSRAYRVSGFDGKSAFELAKLSRRTELVELMEEHLRYTKQERAEVVHCRCGSRLPWKSCHSTGIGQPPHYLEMKPCGTVVYRVSPLARCPCKHTAKAHYKCCWRDSSVPRYLVDTDGNHYFRQARRRPSGRYREAMEKFGLADAEVTPAEMTDLAMDPSDMVAMVRESPDIVRAAFAEEGPQSQMQSWDMDVYAGCLERLKTPFFWKDLHWKLDKSELLARAKRWNNALDTYCDDVGLVGAERDRVVAKHRANPCAPCGRAGCDAFEKEVREFQRCSRCKTISYCGRACQKEDWAEHRKCCIG